MSDSISISENLPLIAGDLKVFPGRFVSGNFDILFEEIEHIGWYWLDFSLNGLNRQKVDLAFYVRNMDKPIRFSKSTLFVQPKLVLAYRYIAQKTFMMRMGNYQKKLHEDGFFIYGTSIIFHSDGRVICNGDTFLLNDAKITPFSISMKKPGLFGKRIHIDMTLDDDVIRALVGHIQNNS